MMEIPERDLSGSACMSILNVKNSVVEFRQFAELPLLADCGPIVASAYDPKQTLADIAEVAFKDECSTALDTLS
jgi:hypothetical protein